MAEEIATISGEEHAALLTKVSKVKEISTKDLKASPKLVVNQNAIKCALLADEIATTSGEEHVASHQKVSKFKDLSAKCEQATTKLVVNQNAIKCALLADETATTSGEEHVASPPRDLKSKKYLQRAKKLHQNWYLIRMSQNMHY